MVQMAWDRGPIPIIERAIDDRDWFKAIVFSAIQLERYGYFVVKEYLESLDVDYNEDILEHLHLSQIALLLLTIEKINTTEYKAIMEINTERNKFMHRRVTKRFQRGKDADRKYKPLANKAIRILREKLNVERLHVSK
jgi:hypothetical protein